MDEDRVAALDLQEREEELKVGSRALNKRIGSLQARAVELRAELQEDLDERRRWAILDEIEELKDDIYAARWGLYELTAGTLGWEYNAADVALWCERAVAMGAPHPRLRHDLLLDLVHVRQVPNAPFREQYERQLGFTTDPARRARVTRNVHRVLSKMEQERGEDYGAASLMGGDNKPQVRVLERWLGLQLNGNPCNLRLFVRYEQAEAMARVFDISPHTAGI